MLSFFQFFIDAYKKLVQAQNPKTPPPNPPPTDNKEVASIKMPKKGKEA